MTLEGLVPGGRKEKAEGGGFGTLSQVRKRDSVVTHVHRND